MVIMEECLKCYESIGERRTHPCSGKTGKALYLRLNGNQKEKQEFAVQLINKSHYNKLAVIILRPLIHVWENTIKDDGESFPPFSLWFMSMLSHNCTLDLEWTVFGVLYLVAHRYTDLCLITPKLYRFGSVQIEHFLRN